MKKRWGWILIVFFQAAVLNGPAMAEDIQVSTYNTSPYGSYTKLKTTGNTYLATTWGGSGNVAIGSQGCCADTLELNGSMKIVDPAGPTGPTPSVGYALTCLDNTGLATWKTAPWDGNLNGGTGDVGYLAYWTTASTLDSAVIKENVGLQKIGIGTRTVYSPLSVSGIGSVNAEVYADNTLIPIKYGIYVKAPAAASVGTYGRAAGTTKGIGVYGNGRDAGIYGVASDANGKGIWGENTGATIGSGVAGKAADYGAVEGVGNGAVGSAGVYGQAVKANPLDPAEITFGVYGKGGWGVWCDAAKCGGNQAWTSPSDRRLKTDITPLADPMSLLRGLRGVTFEWKETPGKPELGFVAQEVLKVVPEVVTKAPDDHYAVRASGLNAVLAEVIKEQQKQIDSLKSRINALESLRNKRPRR